MKKNLTFALIVLLILSWYVSFNTHFGIPKEFDLNSDVRSITIAVDRVDHKSARFNLKIS